MRTARRTFFNILFQPKRIGKHIAKVVKERYKYQKRTYMMDRRLSSTPKMGILTRYQKVKGFKVFVRIVRRTTSKFVKRART